MQNLSINKLNIEFACFVEMYFKFIDDDHTEQSIHAST